MSLGRIASLMYHAMTVTGVMRLMVLQPAALFGDADRFEPRLGIEFLHGNGKVVANGAGAQVQAVGDLSHLDSVGAGSEHVALALRKRIATLQQGGHS